MDKLVIDNTPVSAIGKAAFSRGQVSISEKPLNHVYQLMIFPAHHDEISSHVKTNLGLDLPTIGKLTENQSIKCFAAQPHKWTLISDQPISALAEIGDNDRAAYLDLSSALVAIEVTGEGASDFLQQLCFVDLSKDFATITTQFATDYTVTLEKHPNAYIIYVTRSLARSLWDFLKAL